MNASGRQRSVPFVFFGHDGVSSCPACQEAIPMANRVSHNCLQAVLSNVRSPHSTRIVRTARLNHFIGLENGSGVRASWAATITATPRRR